MIVGHLWRDKWTVLSGPLAQVAHSQFGSIAATEPLRRRCRMATPGLLPLSLSLSLSLSLALARKRKRALSRARSLAVPPCDVACSANVKRFRGGLVFKAYRLLYRLTLGLRVIKKEKKKKSILRPCQIVYN